MNSALLTLALALVWTTLTGTFTLPNLIFGLMIGLMPTWLFRDRLASRGNVKRIGKIAHLVILLHYELFASALRVALLVVTPNLKGRLRPGFVAYPLSVTSAGEIALLANLITLTPGTLSVDVSDDRKFLFIHALDAADPSQVIQDIATGFEVRVKEVFA
jgi:multicomponent Na+:H+ antiporter subunit E